ncbi:MAG: hypothetical protein V4850_14350 [Myxococcota bacterium]
MRLLVLVVILLAACDGAATCNEKKGIARTAWGEVGVRYALALSTAEDAVKEPTGRLAALTRRPDAPAEGKAVLAAEIAARQAEVDTIRPKLEAARAVSTAFAGKTAAEGRALGGVAAGQLEGDDVRAAVALGEAAAAACEGVD